MSTYLELCQDLAREVDITTTALQTTQGQTGQLLDVVSWVRDAWVDIQTESDGKWRWLRKKWSLQTVPDQSTYGLGDITDVESGDTIAVLDRFNQWRVQDVWLPPTIYRNSSGLGTQRRLIYSGYEVGDYVFEVGNQNAQAPSYLAVTPQDELKLHPRPNDVFTVEGEYYRGPQYLTANDDVPECPKQFHKLIVWEGMIHYGFQQAAQESLSRAETYRANLMARLRGNQGEARKMRMAGPLA